MPNSPLALAEIHSHGRYSRPTHLQLLDQALVYLEQRKAPASFLRRLQATAVIPASVPDEALLPFLRLIVEMPPRHAKSETVSKYFAAWYGGRHPDHRCILTSYEDNFARSWGRKARNVLEELGPSLFGVQVSTKTSAANDWEFEGHDGGMLTAGIGGAITGRGANLLIVDDPVKNAQEAASETIQERNWDWWVSTAYTRMEPDGIAVIIQTRWHASDLTGKILADEESLDDEEVWYELKLPALAEAGDVLGRRLGEALWPERYPGGRLDQLKARLGSYYFGALYQQRPSPDEGDLFKRTAWQWYDEPPKGYNPGYIFVDTAGWQENAANDWCAYASVIRVQKDLYWLGAKHGHWTFPQCLQELKDEHLRTGLPICIEDVPWARPLIQVLREDRELRGAVVPYVIGGVKKEVRAHAVSPYHETGRFYLPTKTRWTSDFIDEHATFPNGVHDDWVDTTSMAGLKLLGSTLQLGKPNGDSPQQRQAAGPKGWRRV